MFGLAARPVDQRAIQATPWGQWQGEGYSQVWAGVQVDTPAAIQHLTVYGCCRFICDGIATLPVDVFRETDTGREESTRPPWLDKPTPDLDRVAWLTQILMSLLLDGNAFLKVRRNSAGMMDIVDLTPLDPSRVAVRRDRGRKAFFVAGERVDPFEILHIPGLMLPGADVGVSPVEAARQTIGKGIALDEFSARFFGQGANAGGVIEDPGEIDPAKARMMARVWSRLHGGPSKSHLPGVLQGGAKWVNTGVTQEQSQFLQTQELTASQICAFLFMIDPTEMAMAGGGSGKSITYANIEQRQVRKVQVTYLPWMIRIESALSTLMQSSRYLKFNVDGLLRGDSATRWANYGIAETINTSAVARGDEPVMVTREMRGFEDWPPLAPADVPTPPPPPAAAAPVVDATPPEGA